jgi:hypothetical protein
MPPVVPAARGGACFPASGHKLRGVGEELASDTNYPVWPAASLSLGP